MLPVLQNRSEEAMIHSKPPLIEFVDPYTSSRPEICPVDLRGWAGQFDLLGENTTMFTNGKLDECGFWHKARSDQND